MKILYCVKNRISNKKGSALVVVLLVLVVVSTIGMALLGITATNFKLSASERDYQSVYYIAEAGLNYKLNDIEIEVANFYKNTDTAETFFNHLESYFAAPIVLDSFEVAFGKGPDASVSVTLLENISEHERRYAIISEGTIGTRTRTAEKEIIVQWVSKASGSILTDMAIFSNTSIIIPNGTVSGPVGTNSIQAASIIISGGGSITGEIFVGPSGGEDVVDAAPWINHAKPQPLSAIRNLSMPPIPNSPDNLPLYPDTIVSASQWNKHNLVKDGILNMNSWILQPTNSQHERNTLVLDDNYYFNKISADGNYVLYFDLNGGNRIIVVNDLDMKNGHIKLIGNGKLTMYVLGKISFGSSSTINKSSSDIEIQSKVSQFEMIYKGKTSISLGGGQEIYGSIFSESADIILGNGSGVYGTIVTGGSNVKLDGGTNAVVRTIYAPNAHIMVEGGAEVRGSIIGNSVEMSGGADIIYDPMDGIDIPFFPPSSEVDETIDLIFENTPTREK